MTFITAPAALRRHFLGVAAGALLSACGGRGTSVATPAATAVAPPPAVVTPPEPAMVLLAENLGGYFIPGGYGGRPGGHHLRRQ